MQCTKNNLLILQSTFIKHWLAIVTLKKTTGETTRVRVNPNLQLPADLFALYPEQDT